MKSAVQVPSGADPWWWALAGLLGLLSLWLPKLVGVDGEVTTRLLVANSALFLSGVAMGTFRPRRSWRWAIACFVAFCLRDAAPILASSGLNADGLQHALSFVGDHAFIYLLNALPVLAVAYAGSMVLHAGLES